MGTLAVPVWRGERADRFYPIIALIMAAVIVAGFSTQFLMGRSTFGARLLVHVHALAFMGWVGLFVVQATLGAGQSLRVHRRLGWIAAGWSMLLVALGFAITIDVVRRGTTPFLFQPQFFLIANPLSVILFAALTAWAIAWRKRRDWHPRLHICAMAILLGPAFGRLLPMPLLIPYAFDAAAVACALFPIAGMIRDRRHYGRTHPAWWFGLAALLTFTPVSHALAASPLGDALYRAVVDGSVGARIPGMAFGTMPVTGPVTGR